MSERCFIVAVLCFVCMSFSYSGEACRKEIVIRNSKNWVTQLKNENSVYIINDSLDLRGMSLTVPRNCCLRFMGGYLKNGSIEGNSTRIEADNKQIFQNIILSGTWENKIVFSEWLDFIEGGKVDNYQNFKNLMLLCESDLMTHLYMQKGVYYCSVVTGSSNIKVPSNVYWHNNASIRQLPTDSPKFGFVLLYKCTNTTIDGGEFVGDVRLHLGKDGEWGHGIKLSGAKGVTLKNMIVREFWGDGIDMIEADYVGTIKAGVGICNNISIDNVKCLYNRRQGLSIEAAQNVIVKNSEFAYTGRIKKTAPGCGVDIEPWCNNEKKIENIRFENCDMHDNDPIRDFSVEPNIKYNGRRNEVGGSPVNSVSITKCRIGKLYIYGANTVTFSDCIVEDVSRFDYGENIRMTRCSIKGRSGIKNTKGLIMRRCTR